MHSPIIAACTIRPLVNLNGFCTGQKSRTERFIALLHSFNIRIRLLLEIASMSLSLKLTSLLVKNN